MKKIVLLTLFVLSLLTSCTTLKNEIVRAKLGVGRSELQTLKQTMDPDVVLSDGSALMLYVLNNYMNEDGSFEGQTTLELSKERTAISVELSNSRLWIAYPKKWNGSDSLPILFFAHGGAYRQGDYLSYQDFAGEFADRLDAVVFFPEYRLAPEHKFPSAVDDVWEAYSFMLDNASQYHAKADSVAVVGDSAGGNFAAGLAIRLKENGMRQPSCVVLMYPSLTVLGDIRASHLLFGGFDGRPTMIGGKLMAGIIDDYLENPNDAYLPYASPLLMLQGALELPNWTNPYEASKVELDENGSYVLADHLIQVAQADTLRDDGVSYHALLTSFGTRSTLHTYKGAIHGFVQFHKLLDEGEASLKEACRFIKDHWK